MSNISKKKQLYPLFTTAAAVLDSASISCPKAAASSAPADLSSSDNDDDEFRVPLSSLAPANASKNKQMRKIRTSSNEQAVKKRQKTNGEKKSDPNNNPTSIGLPNEPNRAEEMQPTENISTGQKEAQNEGPKPRKNDSVGEATSEQAASGSGEEKATDESASRKLTGPRSIVHALNRRSINGKHISLPLATFKWGRQAPLSCPLHGAAEMAFDPTGVLLAAASDRSNGIFIWEWDVWVAQNIKRSVKDVPPTWTFQKDGSVNAMQWNSRDQLAVAYKSDSCVTVYNVASAVENPTDSRGRARCVPPSRMGIPLHFTPSTLCFSQTDANRLWVAYPSANRVILWDIDKLAVLWTFQDRVTCIQTMPDSSTLLGGSDGSIRWIDTWNPDNGKKTAFATDKKSHSPTTLELIRPPRRVGGVQNIHTQGLECSWATSNGWVLQVRLSPKSTCSLVSNLSRPTPSMSILYSPPPVKLFQPDGREITQTGPTEYSAPFGRTVCASVGSTLCFKEVPRVKKVLPHHDKYVDSNLEIYRSEKNVLRVLNTRHPHPATVPGRIKLGDWEPTCLAIHPSEEWIVEASGNSKLNVWTTRGR